MAYKDILVQIDAAASGPRYAIAAELAARAGGQLTGLYLKTTLINQYTNIDPIGNLPPEDLQKLIKDNDQNQNDNATRCAEALKRAADDAKASFGWRIVGGDSPDDLISQAQMADLLILPPPAAHAAYSVHASAVDIALAGCPVLLVPEEAAKASIGERALVAWNGSREAARALRDALPLLKPGAKVEVRIARPQDSLRDDSKALAAHLERHGFKSNVRTIEEDPKSVAGWLKAEAASAGCDLIVMGLYGHSRLREFVLGGVSREMLHTPTLPLLIAH